jgi:anti-sigma factor RsiW
LSSIVKHRQEAHYEVVIPDPIQCPDHAEDVAEAYILGTLNAGQAAVFEDHYLGCDACATVLYKAADYVDAMRAAAKKAGQ